MARLLVLLCCAAVLFLTPLYAAPALRRVQTADGERAYLLEDSPPPNRAPLLVFLHGDSRASREVLEAYSRQWEPGVKSEGWHLVLPWNEGLFSFHSDEGVRALQAVVADYCRTHSVDPQRIYLVGHGDGAPGVFTAISRLPGLWAAAVAIGGDANLDIESNRLFAGNAAGIPLLWLYEENRASVLRIAMQRLQKANFPAQFEAANELRAEHAIRWLSEHQAPSLPATVDYETGSISFGANRWVRIRALDFSLRNDVLASTRVDPGNGAFLRLGGFGYDPEGKGPGVPVKWLPDNYKGPLHLDDTIVSIAGTMVEDAAHYAEVMEGQRESRDVGIILMRKGKRTRIETRIVIPQRDETETARILAEYLPESKEILVVSRGVSKAELRIPPTWAPVKVNWNGADIAVSATAGCLLLDASPTPAAARKHQRNRDGESNAVAHPVPCDGDSSSDGL